MSLVLHTISGSPFGWRTQLAIAHKGVDHEVHHVKPSEGELRSEAFLAMNPRGKVPVLQDGDLTLYESTAIMEYLDDRAGSGPRLYPEDGAERARIRRLVCETDLYWWDHASKVAGNLYFTPEEKWDQGVIESGAQGLVKELGFFAGQIRGETFAGDGQLSAADFALYPMLAHLARYDRRKPELSLDAAIPGPLRSMMQRVEGQSYFDDTFPPHWR